MRPIRVRALALGAALALSATTVWAQVVQLEITSREPMNSGETVGTIGPFELIRGKVHHHPNCVELNIHVLFPQQNNHMKNQILQQYHVPVKATDFHQ